jgi:ATP-dependent Lhr-like helicase
MRCWPTAARPANDGCAKTCTCLPPAAQQLAAYLAASRAALGTLPSRRHIVFERFFDEIGDTHLVIHSPFGSRINKAWGLALRKRMCRKFNFELQASALEDSIVLSLGPTHSFPLEEVKAYLKSASARELLVQALLDAPMFGTRWRWNATAALAVRRMNGGKRVPPQFQRSDAQDLLTVVFPEQQACAENLMGEREIPDHPLVAQTLDDCLHETMDVDGFVRLLAQIEAGEVSVTTCDLTSPSPMSHAILNARPYAFLDDGAAEERRTKAVSVRPLADVQSAADLGRLDPQVIAQVVEEAQPDIGNADELHDALVVHGFLTDEEADFPEFMATLMEQRRMTRLHLGPQTSVFVAAERLHELRAVFPEASLTPPIEPVDKTHLPPEDGLREILRGRLELLGPVTAAALGAPLGIGESKVHAALLALEAEGSVMRGTFTGSEAEEEWCDRRLLARMHRQTRDKLRAEIRPLPPAQFMRFLFRWHQLDGADDEQGDERREGESALAEVLRQLEGFPVAAAAWEEDLLAARIKDYSPQMLDRLCAAGRIAWWRPAENGEAAARKSGPIRGTPIILGEREALAHWRQGHGGEVDESLLSGKARQVLEVLREHGASFFGDLQHDARLLPAEVELALGELVAQGLVTCDSFAGLRALVMPADKREKLRRRHHGRDPMDERDAGHWHAARAALIQPRQVRWPTRTSSTSRACCCAATACCFAGCWNARRACRRGATCTTCCVGWRRAARSVAAAS